MLTKDLLDMGYEAGLVRIVESPHMDGIVCSIGENWFYFSGYYVNEATSVEDYFSHVSKDMVIEDLYETLDDFRFSGTELEDEALYYENFLRENLELEHDNKYPYPADMLLYYRTMKNLEVESCTFQMGDIASVTMTMIPANQKEPEHIQLFCLNKETGEVMHDALINGYDLKEVERILDSYRQFALGNGYLYQSVNIPNKLVEQVEHKDYSHVKPLNPPEAFHGMDRAYMQPILDALEQGEFDLAAALTPEKYRLCGFQEFKEPFEIQQYGHTGYAAHYETTIVPPGIYPVFAEKFQYHEAKKQFMHEVKNFGGIVEWLEGTCVASNIGNASKDNFKSYQNVVYETPYNYYFADIALQKDSPIHLLAPFDIKEVFYQYDGKILSSYRVCDSSLPEYLDMNPIKLRHGLPNKVPVQAEKNEQEIKPSLEAQVKQANDKVVLPQSKNDKETTLTRVPEK